MKHIEAVNFLDRNLTIQLGKPIAAGAVDFAQGYSDGNHDAIVGLIAVDEQGNVKITFAGDKDGNQIRRDWLFCNEPCIVLNAVTELAAAEPTPPEPQAEAEIERRRQNLASEGKPPDESGPSIEEGIEALATA